MAGIFNPKLEWIHPVLVIAAALATSPAVKAQDVVIPDLGTIAGNVSVAGAAIRSGSSSVSASAPSGSASGSITANASDSSQGTFSFSAPVPSGSSETYGVGAVVRNTDFSKYFQFPRQTVVVTANTTSTVNFSLANPAFLRGTIRAVDTDGNPIPLANGSSYVDHRFGSGNDFQRSQHSRLPTAGAFDLQIFPTNGVSTVCVFVRIEDGRSSFFCENIPAAISAGDVINRDFTATFTPVVVPDTGAVDVTVNPTFPAGVTFNRHDVFVSGVNSQTLSANGTASFADVPVGSASVTVRTWMDSFRRRLDDPDSAYALSRQPTVTQGTTAVVNVSPILATISGSISTRGVDPALISYLEVDARGQLQSSTQSGFSEDRRPSVSTSKAYEVVATAGTWTVGVDQINFFENSLIDYVSGSLRSFSGVEAPRVPVTILDSSGAQQDFDLAFGQTTINFSVAQGSNLVFSNPSISGWCYKRDTNNITVLQQFVSFSNNSSAAQNVTAAPVRIIALEGTCNLSARAQVGGSNLSLGSVTIDIVPGVDQVIDVGGPILTIASPEPDLITSGTSVTVSGTATDDVAVDTVVINGASATLTSTSNPADAAEVSFALDVQNLARGPNEILTIATDTSGKQGQDRRTVFRDEAPPSVFFEPPDQAVVTDAATSTSIEVFGTANDDAGIDSVTLQGQLIGTSLTGDPQNPNEAGFSENLTIQAGSNFVEIVATDISTRSTTETHEIILNNPPIAAINFVDTPPAPVDEVFQISGTGSSDPNSGPDLNDTIDSYEWDLDGDGQFDDATGASISPTFPSVGNLQIGLRVTDSFGAQATTNAELEVFQPNSAPDAVDDADSTDEDTAVTVDVLANDTDVDGDSLTVSQLVSAPSNGSAVINPDSTISYTPDPDFNGSDSFSYEASDGNGANDTATVTLTVDAVNDAPEANDDAAATNEDAPIAISVLSNDSDLEGDSLTVISASAPSDGAAVVNANNTITYTPDADFNGADSFTYTIEDGNGGSDTATVTVDIAAVNDDPDAMDDAYNVDEDGALTVAALGVLANDTDTDGDTLTVTSNTSASNGAVTVNADGSFSYTPDADFNGADSFTYTIEDGNGGSDTATVSITVDPVNDAPAAADQTVTTDEDTGVAITVTADDTDGDTLGYVLVTSPANGSLGGTLPDVTYTPDADFNGPDAFTFKTNDGQADSNVATVSITVNAVNDAPVANDDAATTDEDTAVTIPVLANDTDVDGDTPSVASVGSPSNGLATLNPDGTVTYTPSANYNGSDSFTYTIGDGNGGTATATVSITVNAVNDAPVANDDAATTDEDTAVTIPVLANDTDVDGDTPSVASVGSPSNGLATLNPDGTVTYTPSANYNGSDSFTYTIGDGNGGTATATVAVTINAVNDAPVAADDAYTTDEDTLLTVPGPGVLGNDSDVEGDALAAILVGGPSNGTLTLNSNGSFSYTPVLNFNGSDGFTYVANDSQADSSVAIVSITVNAVNDAPVAADDAAMTDEDVPVTIAVLANDSDVEGDSLTVSSVSSPANGTATINVDGTVTYSPALNFNGVEVSRHHQRRQWWCGHGQCGDSRSTRSTTRR